MTALAARLRAMARAIRTGAEERAEALDAMAAEVERGADEVLPLDEAARVAGIRGKDPARVLRDEERRGRLAIEGPRSSRVVRRSELSRWLRARAPTPIVRAAEDDARAEARASVERAAVRMGAAR